uniref:Ig-like domain-containing protein n=1 Tax=Poecilia formosa TaxID=48698 RepID=A0A096M9G3_POEFO
LCSLLIWFSGALANSCGSLTPALNITTPNIMEALTGSCLQIPCTYETEDPKYDSSKTIYGVWLKGGVNFWANASLVIFNSSGSINKYSLNMTGNLKEKNCTTLFPDIQTSHADKYYFRVENGDYKATACADPLQIKVKDSPWSPSINVPSDLKEHQSVTVTCSAFTPCPHSPPQLTWNLQQDSLRQTEKNTDGTFTTKIPGLVSAGSWVELSCSSRAKPPPRFTWFRNSKDGDINVSVEKMYGFNATEGGEFHCVASNDLGQQKSSVILVGIREDYHKTTTYHLIVLLIWNPVRLKKM